MKVQQVCELSSQKIKGMLWTSVGILISLTMPRVDASNVTVTMDAQKLLQNASIWTVCVLQKECAFLAISPHFSGPKDSSSEI